MNKQIYLLHNTKILFDDNSNTDHANLIEKSTEIIKRNDYLHKLVFIHCNIYNILLNPTQVGKVTFSYFQVIINIISFLFKRYIRLK